MYLSRFSTRRHLSSLLFSVAFLVCILLYLTHGTNEVIDIPVLPQEDLQTFSSRAINNTVMIVAVNTGMLHWAENLLCSFKATTFDVSNLVFWALDAHAKQVIEEKGLAAYHDPSLFATSTNENKQGNTASYNRMMRERPKFFMKILSAGLDILMIDADTIWWQNPFSIVPDSHDRPAVDIVYSTDAREFYQDHDAFRDVWRRGPFVPPICNGIFWMKSTPATISLWKDMLAIFEAPWYKAFFRPKGFQDDQRGMDVLLNHGRAQVVAPFPEGIHEDQVPTAAISSSDAVLKVRLLDQTSIANGQLLMNRQSRYAENLAKLRQSGGNRIAAHFNWDTTVVSKEDGAKELGLVLLDENGRCVN